MTTNNVPKATLQRYPVYLKGASSLTKKSVLRESCQRNFQVLLILNQQRFVVIFLFLGNLGKQGYGLCVDKLIEIFNGQLGVNFG